MLVFPVRIIAKPHNIYGRQAKGRSNVLERDHMLKGQKESDTVRGIDNRVEVYFELERQVSSE